jgi:hypothetical protein
MMAGLMATERSHFFPRVVGRVHRSLRGGDVLKPRSGIGILDELSSFRL